MARLERGHNRIWWKAEIRRVGMLRARLRWYTFKGLTTGVQRSTEEIRCPPRGYFKLVAIPVEFAAILIQIAVFPAEFAALMAGGA